MNADRLREARRAAYRQLILEAAERVFAERGFEATHISNVAEEAGVSVGTLYGVFGSKAELFHAVLTHRLPEILKRASEAAAGAGTAMESLVLGMDAYIGYLLTHSDWLRVHLYEHAWGLGPTRGASEQLVAWREGLEFHARVLEAAMEEGAVLRGDPLLLARSIWAVHQVHLAAWVDAGMEEPPEAVRERIGALFLNLFCIPEARR